MRNIIIMLGLVLGLVILATSIEARSLRGEYYEGRAEVRRERREMYHDIMKSDSRREARQAYREGMREIRREKREMRREWRRHQFWNY
jgi:hypothetical protein